jgi:5-methylcytosine-specific restriction enzyme subunit McrC
LRSQQRTLIIDAKYYQKTLTSFHGSKTFHSANLYQINAYLDNVAVYGGNDAVAEGLLLYPVTQETVSASYSIGSKTIRVETLDLTQDWKCIENDLRTLLSKKTSVEGSSLGSRP